jgi:hypothetical protein
MAKRLRSFHREVQGVYNPSVFPWGSQQQLPQEIAKQRVEPRTELKTDI